MAQRRWLLHSHSQLGSTFFKQQTSRLHLSIWPPNHRTINSYYPQDVRPPPRRRATPIKTRTRDPPNSNFRRRAFRDDCLNCIEQAAPPGSPRPTHRAGMGPLPAALRSALRHPLNAPDSGRRALILRMSATHSPSPLLPPTPAATCLLAHQAQTCLAVAFSAGPSSGSSILREESGPLLVSKDTNSLRQPDQLNTPYRS